MGSNLTTILRHAGLLTEQQEQATIERVNRQNGSVPSALVDLDFFDGAALLGHLTQLFGISTTTLNLYDFTQCAHQLAIQTLICRHNVLPLEINEQHILLGISDPTNNQVENELQFCCNKRVEVILIETHQLDSAIHQLYAASAHSKNSAASQVSSKELAEAMQLEINEPSPSTDIHDNDAPVSRYIHQILLTAVKKGASDIHFEPYETLYRIRMRCDGLLYETSRPSHHLSRRLSSRLKILGKLDIAERRLPQDGRIKLPLTQDSSMEFRISTLPTLWGEKIVLRLIDSRSSRLAINELGFSTIQQQLFVNALTKPRGLVLVTGPTGSGKTVTLYAGLNHLNAVERNISTVEDPIEMNIEGVNQVHINPAINLTFSSVLKAFLRQDPDVLMIGEVRDFETADIAIKASQTGHLVLSTLHTNSAAETIIRLSSMGIELYNLLSAVSLVIAQRLARRLCSYCKVVEPNQHAIKAELGITQAQPLYKAKTTGCERCNEGYYGRIGVYEVMPIDPRLLNNINKESSAAQLQSVAIEQGMITLNQSGLLHLSSGIISYPELQRILLL